MRLSQVLVLIAASLLFTSEALSATMDSKISKVTSPGASSQRLLRVHHSTVEDDDDSEERGLTSKYAEKLAAYADDLGFNLQRAEKSQTYLLQNQAKYK